MTIRFGGRNDYLFLE